MAVRCSAPRKLSLVDHRPPTLIGEHQAGPVSELGGRLVFGGWQTGQVSTADEKLASELHGVALLAAQDPALQPLLDRLAELADGLDDVRTQTAGELAGAWFAAPGRHIGHELIAAGLLILSGVVDRDQLEEAVRVGYERGRGSLQGYDPTDATG